MKGALQVRVVEATLESGFENGVLRLGFGAAYSEPVKLGGASLSLTLDSKLEKDETLPALTVDVFEVDVQAASVAVDVTKVGEQPTKVDVALPNVGSVTLEMSWAKDIPLGGYTPVQVAWGVIQRVYCGATSLPVVRPLARTTEGVLNWSLEKTGVVGLLLPETDPEVNGDTSPKHVPTDRTPLEKVDARFKELLQVVDGHLDRPISAAVVRVEAVLRKAADNPYVKKGITISKPVGKRLPYISQLYPEEGSNLEDEEPMEEQNTGANEATPEAENALAGTQAPEEEEPKMLDDTGLPNPKELHTAQRSLSEDASVMAAELAPSTPERSTTSPMGKRNSLKKRLSKVFSGSKEKSSGDSSDSGKKPRRSSFGSPFSRGSVKGTI